MTLTRGEVGADNGGKGGSVARNMYKGHMDKAKGRIKGGKWGWLGGRGGEWRQLYLNNNKKNKKKRLTEVKTENLNTSITTKKLQ